MHKTSSFRLSKSQSHKHISSISEARIDPLDFFTISDSELDRIFQLKMETVSELEKQGQKLSKEVTEKRLMKFVICDCIYVSLCFGVEQEIADIEELVNIIECEMDILVQKREELERKIEAYEM